MTSLSTENRPLSPASGDTTTIGTEREAELLNRVPDGLYIDGTWQPGTGEPIIVTDPATGRELTRIANAG
ncbi:hypothetical protein QN345_20295, partial [Cryobacterium sp. 10I1]|nr:hypothetical protein [Cryobacterium sp. 10I1]